MNGWDRFEHLAAQARREPAPRVDVVDAVRRRVCGLGAPAPRSAWPALGFALCASATAVLAVLGYQAWLALADPTLGWVLGVSPGWLL